MILQRQIRRTGDRNRRNIKLGLLGREDSTLRGSSGRLFVRELLATGRYSPSVELPLAVGAQVPVQYNIAVNIGYDRTGQRVILGLSQTATATQGLPSNLANASDGQNLLLRLDQLQPLRCRPSGQATKELYAEVLPARVVIDGTSFNWAGGDIDLSGDVPSSGNHLYSLVAFTTAGALESAVSTAQSTATALDNTDIQEAYDALTTGSLPIKAFVLANGDTALDGTLTTGAIDLRQMFNSGSGGVDTSLFVLLAGRAGGQIVHGGTASGEDLTLISTSHATPGSILFGTAGPAGVDSRGILFSDGGTVVSNVFVGSNAGDAATTGTDSVGIGENALSAMTTASFNVAIGTDAAVLLQTGSGNFALGNIALSKQVAGNGSVAIGNSALLNATAGGNIGIGEGAGQGITSGDNHIFIGAAAGGAVATGSRNIGIGKNALKVSTDSYNIAIGYRTMLSATTATNSTAVGYQSLILLTTGDNNTALGYQSGFNNDTGSDNVYIGYNVRGVASESDMLYIHNANSTTPLILGDFSAGLTIHSQATGAVVFTVSEIASQTGNASERVNSSGTIISANRASNNINPHSFIQDKRTLSAGVSDGYTSGIELHPQYDAAFTVTRHNYLNVKTPTLTTSAVVTDAALARFDAAAGTHAAVDSGTTKTTPGSVDAWLKMNINGTIYYVPAYTSKTA